jgi:hypothetical protein
MRKRRYIWVLAGCGLAALIALLVFPKEREPEHGGRKLREWLKLCMQSPGRFRDHPEAAEAVRQIGTNALPLLLKWADHQPPEWKLTLNAHAELMPGYFRSAYRRWLFRGAVEDIWLAKFGFKILGPQAKPALAELHRRMTDWEKPSRAGLSMDLYTQIGGPGSVSALVSALVSTNATCRQHAAFHLASLGTNGAPAALALRNALNDPDPAVSKAADNALTRLAGDDISRLRQEQ